MASSSSPTSVGISLPSSYGIHTRNASTRSCQCCFSKSSVMGCDLLCDDVHKVAVRLYDSSRIRYTPHAAMRSTAGFGKQPDVKATPKISKELEVGKVEKIETYVIFARKVAGEEAITKWEKIGEILVEAGASVETALKERKNALAAGVKHQHPFLVILEKGETVQYGIRLSTATEVPKDGEKDKKSEENDAEITVPDLRGKPTDELVPAILRVDDGKPPPKKILRKS